MLIQIVQLLLRSFNEVCHPLFTNSTAWKVPGDVECPYNNAINFSLFLRISSFHHLKHHDYLCPPIAIYLKSCYQIPARLFISVGREIKSAEGTTQGDPTAMPGYGIGILPLLDLTKDGDPLMKHAAYADDLGG